MISNQAKILNFILKIIKPKKYVNLEKPSRRKGELIPKIIKNSFNISTKEIEKHSTVTIEPKSNCGQKHILYFHGGAYTIEGNYMHWNFIKKIIKESFFRVTYIDYPLAPENKYTATFKMIHESYNYLTEKHPADKFIFMGDSAGGGLALAFCQNLIEKNKKKLPEKLVLFSPWLDLSMQNSEIKKNEKLDMILSVDSLKKAAKLYAREDDLSQYLLSPINGRLDLIPSTAIYYGTEEIFYPDFIKFKKLTKKYSENFTFFEYEKMQHVWILFPIPETEKAINDAISFMNDNLI